MKTVSILIPAYNAENTISRCINSVINQTYTDLEIVIVNDGSEDSTLEICLNYEIKDSRVKVLNQMNQGVSAARNNALDNATGEFILFGDADDWMESIMVERMVSVFCTYNDCDIVFCSHDFAEDPADVETDQDRNDLEMWNRDKQQLEFLKHRKMTGMLWNKMFRASLFDNVRFDPSVSYGEDAQALWKILKYSLKMAVLDETLYHHVLDNKSISHQKYSSKKFSSVKVWEGISIDVLQNYPQWKSIVEERRLENATWLSYEMRRGGTINKTEKDIMRNIVKKNLHVILRKNDISVKMKIFAIIVAIGF